MDERLSRLELKLSELALTLEDVERRLATLERQAYAHTQPLERAATQAVPHEPTESQIAGGIALIGRTLLVLGGAYLLRAFTEGGLLPLAVGISLGFLYALVWIYFVDRASAHALNLSGAFHGAAAAIIAYPLLVEATGRFKLLTPAFGALGLLVTAVLLIWVAWRRNLPALAWLGAAGGILTAWTLIIGTRALVPFASVLVLLAVGVVWLSFERGWPILAWVASGAADLTLVVVGLGALAQADRLNVASVVSLQLVFLLLFAGTFAARISSGRAAPGLFEAVQLAAAVLIGYGGAVAASRGSVFSMTVLIAGVALAAGCYALSKKAFPETARSYYFSTAALLLLLIAPGALSAGASFFWCVLALAASWLGARRGNFIASVHGALYALAAAVASGLVKLGAYAFLARATVGWPEISVANLGVLATVGLCCGLTVPPTRWGERVRRFPKLLLLIALAWGVGGVLLAVVTPVLAGPAGRGADAGVLAAVRTIVLAMAALVLATVGRTERLREAGWLVYPVLLAAGIKLIVEDFPNGRAQTLFIGLAFYGGALVAATRLGARVPS